MLKFVVTIVALLVVGLCTAHAQVPGNCGMQLGGPVIFCDTFDVPNPGIPSRTGDLHPDVWGVSRLTGNMNPGQQVYSGWAAATTMQTCTGTAVVAPPRDILICNGQLRSANNDNPQGCFECGSITVVAMYPKQPFDYAGRTGTISFDIANDSHGSHAAWPEFWFSDLPVPAPFAHGGGNTQSVPKDGWGLKFQGVSQPGETCGGRYPADGLRRWTIGDVVVVRNYIVDDSEAGGGTRVTVLDCVIAPSDDSGILNHVEIQVSQNQIDVYATDAGTMTPLKHIATVSNANLTVTRGLIWLEDVHYNADKGALPSQKQHTFVWDNVAFDGPFTFRDFSYDALDANQPKGDGFTVNLGKPTWIDPTWAVLGMPANPQAAVARVLFNFFNSDPITAMTVSVNGHSHAVPWIYPDMLGGSRTRAVDIPLTDLVAGTNMVTFGVGPNEGMIVFNVNIVLGNVPGGVPVLPGSNNSYPAGTPVPVNGICGSANGVPTPVAPTANLCTAGIASAVSGSGPWSWSCAGSNGGTTAICSAPLQAPVPTASIVAAPATIVAGQSSTLTWLSTGATSCAASGAWTGARATSGTLGVSPATTSTYSLTCSGAGGTSPMASATVTVTSAPPAAGRVAVTGTSGFHNNTPAIAVLPADTQKTTYICGFVITSTGSTAAQAVSPTVAGVIGGTLNYTYASVAGVRAANHDLLQPFAPCLPASGLGVPIVVTLPALGAGNTNATVNAWGYQR